MAIFSRKVWGILNGLAASAAFGLIPLFTLPMLAAGIPVQTALVYRFGIAAAAMFLILLLKRQNLKIGVRAFLKIAGVSLLYMFAVLFYFYSLEFLPGGLVATLLFVCPVIVILVMVLFFHEKFRWQIGMAAILAIAGVALLSSGSGESSAYGDPARTAAGLIFILIAALANALYLVGIQVISLPKIDDLVLNFYVLLTGSVFCFLNALLTDSLEWISSASGLVLASMLALVTAVFSNLTLILAIRAVGSSMSAILGGMEPLTAVCVGCAIFNEPFSAQFAAGALLIVASVLLALLAPGRKV